MNARINTSALGESDATMLTAVDFKWLMAGQGCWVDTARLHQDSSYAHACFQQAQILRCAPLTQCVERLSGLLGARNAS